MPAESHRGRFVCHELLTTDTKAAEGFFTKVVGWNAKPFDQSYTLFLTGKQNRAGLMALPAEAKAMGAPPHWESYVAVPNVDESAKQATALGGKVLKAPTDIPNVGRFAVLQDPQGATFAIFKGTGDMPIEEPPLRADLAPPNATSTVESRAPSEEPAKSGEVKLLGSVSWGDAVTKVQPRYPAKAKRVNASGPVDVQVTISAEGRVIEAKATSGHTLLREAAEEAARQWVFKPATLNGAPVETQRVLTFLFKAPQ